MNNYVRVYYENKGERYLREDNGDEVRFAKQVHILFKQEEVSAKLSYTRAVDSLPTKAPVACVRIDGEKYMLDHEEIEVAEDCLLAA